MPESEPTSAPADSEADQNSADPSSETGQVAPESKSPPNVTSLDKGTRQLPGYARSLLKIKVPVIVTLASAKQTVQDIVDLVPGSMIQFTKSCEDPLSLEVTNQAVALGEAVKVGDKFGIRITQIVMPEERFDKIRKMMSECSDASRADT
ncbi:MAG: FliM/FliN family flagellar motor switch protein [Planctomycetes bacterium]|nr:FliM/FliN family flagellar motor switch protein [Planctomycetota bacterium]